MLGTQRKHPPGNEPGGWADTKVKAGQLVGCEAFRLRETQSMASNPAPSSP
jgi:hypothetical protein